jgi:hypothetical protein
MAWYVAVSSPCRGCGDVVCTIGTDQQVPLSSFDALFTASIDRKVEAPANTPDGMLNAHTSLRIHSYCVV